MTESYILVKNNIIENIVLIDSEDLETVERLTNEGFNVLLKSNYVNAEINAIWNDSEQKFYPVKPYSSWVWNDNENRWTAPIPYPAEDGEWAWNEDLVNYVNLRARVIHVIDQENN